jgi:gluconolactonase
MKIFLTIGVLAGITICNVSTDVNERTKEENTLAFIGELERYDPTLDEIISPEAKAEIIADSLQWSEGPLWIEQHQMLLFSDVPTNTVYKWTEDKGKEIYLKPSGFTGTATADFREPGSNGLLLDKNGKLILCQHGDRRLATMNAPLDRPSSNFTTLAAHYKGKKFSSPNDAAQSSNGDLYFTDPPYGLKKMDKDSLKELSWNGVYKVKGDGSVILLMDSVSKPNGIALFPGEKRLLVANSDPAKPNWYVWDIEDDKLTHGRLFFAAAPYDASWKGLPDGLKIDRRGNVIASGPGGIYFFNSEGKKLGLLRLNDPASNCALTPDEKTLFITNDNYTLRVKMKE